MKELSELVILREAVADAPNWPGSPPEWRRFATYVLLPVLSWLATKAIAELG